MSREIICLLSLLLGGCVVMTPSASVTALEMASVAVTHAASLTSSSPSNTVQHPHDAFSGACIELNRNGSVADFVPALQAELSKNGVESRVYGEAMPASCRFTIHYSSAIAWGKRMFEDDFSPYMSEARLELRERGKILAASSYKPSVLGTDKWSATADKLAPAVRVLVKAAGPGAQATAKPAAAPATTVQEETQVFAVPENRLR
ncbi:hypothetical protein ACFONG_13405 [Uliginosibacterium paludis]|uniref:Cell division protein FtsI n=1 Tax=Uliginosibacterium paludis TaxID=1615952 RepID=A0ABV2CPS0_9RHOO